MLDGGLATELENRGHDLSGKLWSAVLLDTQPGEIEAVHLDYLDAGADCITAASYQASIPGFLSAGYPEQKAIDLLRRSVEIACSARDRYLDRVAAQAVRPLVAASIGPWGAYLADGSEYSGDYPISRRELRSFHEPRWQILTDAGADLLAIETIPNYEEAEVLLELLDASPGVEAWVSFSCKDGIHISDGTPVAECAALFSGCEQVVAVGVNCTAPAHLDSLLRQVRLGEPEKPMVAYPNSGERYDGRNNTWSGDCDPFDLGGATVGWFKLGARLLGGCCRTGPADISAMKQALMAEQKQDGTK